MNALRRGPRYLLRFDDICPTLDWELWNAVEARLVAHGVKPILAVIPDNQDPKLLHGPAAPDFWDRVRAWQARGWTIGLHGYQHRYVNGEPGLLGFPRKSEFAGLGPAEQREKLVRGLEIFRQEGIRADTWVAPSHSFDRTTLAILRELGIRTVSDGLAFGPFRDGDGMVWVPQQSALMRPMPFGTWTFCYHAGDFEGDGMARFEAALARLAPRMISFEEAVADGVRERSALDSVVPVARRLATLARWRPVAWTGLLSLLGALA